MMPEGSDGFEAKVKVEIRGEVKGSDITCAYYPCHFEGQDCTFCYCPLYPCLDSELGVMVMGRKGREVWSCKDCFFVHLPEVAKELHLELQHRMEELPAQDEKVIILRGLCARFGKRPRS